MADAADSKSVARKGVWVQVPPPAFLEKQSFSPKRKRPPDLFGRPLLRNVLRKAPENGP